MTFQLPELITVLTTAAIDSINPCAIGVLILMISVLIASKKSTKQMLKMGLLYIFVVFLVYLGLGLGLTYFMAQIPVAVSEYITMGIALILTIAGVFEIKDYFWYGKGFSLSIPPRYSKKIHKLSKNTTAGGVIILGAFVAAVELPCTGGPYLAIITILSQSFDFSALLLLILYNLVFVMPLVVILLLVVGGKEVYNIKSWKQKHRPKMRLAGGLLMIALSWLLMFIANGTIHLN